MVITLAPGVGGEGRGEGALFEAPQIFRALRANVLPDAWLGRKNQLHLSPNPLPQLPAGGEGDDAPFAQGRCWHQFMLQKA